MKDDHGEIDGKGYVPDPHKTGAYAQLRSGGFVIHLPRWGLLILICLLAVPWVFTALDYLDVKLPQRGTAFLLDTAVSESGLQRCRPGPWGELEYLPILIEPPREFVSSNYALDKEIRWYFPGYTIEALSDLLDSCGMTAAHRRVLKDRSRWLVTPKGIVITPPREAILGLRSDARACLYTALSEFAENPPQHLPYLIREEFAEEWFEKSGLSDTTLRLVKSLLYRRGKTLMFSDHHLVLPMLPSGAERARLMKALGRKSTLMVKLRISPHSDIGELVDYWGRGGRDKDVEPLLQSLSREPDGVTLDIAHLLPAFARMRLYTYPLPSLMVTQNDKDCHWTSMNFFSRDPEEHYLPAEATDEAFAQDYFPVPGDPALGDILLFIRQDLVAIHSCVYIADDIVFTKNGKNFMAPWILMKLSDVIASYPSTLPVEIRTYRHRDFTD